jgi:hypothetical protein
MTCSGRMKGVRPHRALEVYEDSEKIDRVGSKRCCVREIKYRIRQDVSGKGVFL